MLFFIAVFVVKSAKGFFALAMPAPSHRIRPKSAPRGRSPDPRTLKKAAAKAKSAKQADGAFVTPHQELRTAHQPVQWMERERLPVKFLLGGPPNIQSMQRTTLRKI